MPNSKIKEANFWGGIRTALKVFKSDIHYTRVENSVSDGFPDLELHLKSRGSAQFELKTASRPVRSTTSISVGVRLGQVKWLTKRWAVGGACFLYIQVGSGRELKRYIIPGSLAKMVHDGVTETTLADYSIVDPGTPIEVQIAEACAWRKHC